MNKERQSDVDREHGIDDEDDCDDYSDNKEDSDGDDDGDVKQEVMQKDGQSESEREHDEGGGTTYQSGQSSGGVFFATAFQSAIRGARITKKCISQSVCFIQTKCFCNALDVIRVPRVPKSIQKCPECPKMSKSVKSI